MSLETKNPEENIIRPAWEEFVPGGVFDASVPLRVHLHGEDVDYLELSLKDGRRFAIIYFDTKKRQVIIRGHEGREVPVLVNPFNKPFPIGRDSLKHYTWFFGETERAISSEQCIVTVVEPCEGPDGEIYPVAEIVNRSRSGTFCKVFQRPRPPNSQTPAA